MKNFDKKWRDFPDYIIGITKEIWEDRGLATLNHYYAENIPMRFPSGLTIGNQAAINGTLSTLAEFPNRQLIAEDVIWCGDDEEGYLSSHRILTMGTHTGHGFFGAPTGKKFVIRAIANCAAKQNVIYDEWLTRDVSALVMQLGMEPKQFARDWIAREGGAEHCAKPFTPDQDVDGGYHSKGNDNEWGQKFADILTRIMSKDLSVIQLEYDRAVQAEHPGGKSGHSWADVEQYWMGLRASFPTAKFKIHHVIGRHDPLLPPRSAIRWSLTGKHDGMGMFGAPTGANVHIMGFSHADFGPYGLRREFTLYDEVSIWKQIYMQQG
ncbi:MAG: nuclear transport factor 2 family protein [Rhizobiales bacterium]|nr:ester cyclase [Hyphomicrobiales bacterium]NRB13910.1 nuclear transport factor 2 family protein [Hyphomicrobiales bacterium]